MHDAFDVSMRLSHVYATRLFLLLVYSTPLADRRTPAKDPRRRETSAKVETTRCHEARHHRASDDESAPTKGIGGYLARRVYIADGEQHVSDRISGERILGVPLFLFTIALPSAADVAFARGR